MDKNQIININSEYSTTLYELLQGYTRTLAILKQGSPTTYLGIIKSLNNLKKTVPDALREYFTLVIENHDNLPKVYNELNHICREYFYRLKERNSKLGIQVHEIDLTAGLPDLDITRTTVFPLEIAQIETCYSLYPLTNDCIEDLKKETKTDPNAYFPILTKSSLYEAGESYAEIEKEFVVYIGTHGELKLLAEGNNKFFSKTINTKKLEKPKTKFNFEEFIFNE